MSIRRWIIGLIATAFAGVVDGVVIALADPNIQTRALIIAVAALACKNLGFWMKQHPVEEVTGETQIIIRQKPDSTETDKSQTK